MQELEPQQQGSYGEQRKQNGERPRSEPGTECELCLSVVDTDRCNDTTLSDRSGASHVVVCDDCLETYSEDRCHICGEAKTGRHKSNCLIAHEDIGGEEDNCLPVCDGCRRSILIGEGVRT